MPAAASITKNMIDKTAFELLRTQGMEALTARNIAAQVGCSTQPIYKIYPNLDALKEDALQQAIVFTRKYIYSYKKTTIPFLNAGLGFIRFAAEEKVLFSTFFARNALDQPVFLPLHEPNLYEMMVKLLAKLRLTTTEEQKRELFFNTMVYSNGLAHLACAGQLNMTEKQVSQKMAQIFRQFVFMTCKKRLFL